MPEVKTKKSKIGMKYLKRTGEIFKDIGTEYFTQLMPTTASIPDKAIDMGSKVVETTKGVIPKVRQLKAQIHLRNIGHWFLGEELKYDDTTEDDKNLGYDDESVDREDTGEEEESESQKAAKQISKTTVETTHKMFEANQQFVANIMKDIEDQTSTIEEGVKELREISGYLKNIDDNLAGFSQVNVRNSAALLGATLSGQRTDQPKRDEASDLIGNGRFMFDTYSNMVKKNFLNNSLVSMVMTELTPFIENVKTSGIMGAIDPKTILRFGTDQLLNHVFPNLKEGIQEIDRSISDMLLSSLMRVGDKAGDDIAEIFGIRSGRRTVSTEEDAYSSQVSTDVVAWDGISRESLVNTIPGYLRKILVQLGGPDVIYDYRSRNFTERSVIAEEFYQNTTIGEGNLNYAKKNIRNALWDADSDEIDHKNSKMLYDMLLSDLGARSATERDEMLEEFKDRNQFASYMDYLTRGMDLTDDQIEDFLRFIDAFSGLMDKAANRNSVSIQAATAEVKRAESGRNYVRDAMEYNIDLRGLGLQDSLAANRRAILARNDIDVPEEAIIADEDYDEEEEVEQQQGEEEKEKRKRLPVVSAIADLLGVSEKAKQKREEKKEEKRKKKEEKAEAKRRKNNEDPEADLVPSSLDYENGYVLSYGDRALYEIYRRLEKGVNVFITGKASGKDRRKKPYKKFDALPPPRGYKVPSINENPESAEEEEDEGSRVVRKQFAQLIAGRDPDDPNLLKNNPDEEEESGVENLSGFDRFKRWGKKRGGALKDAVLSGDKEQVSAAMSAIYHDIADVAGDKMKEGIEKINNQFGNVSGWLKHKMFGTAYSYTDEDGFVHNIEENTGEDGKGGGLFGFVRSKVSGIFEGAGEKTKDWWNTVKSYFDDGDNDKDADAQTKNKRKRLLATSVGAIGGGLLGGPIGLLMGSVAGNALSMTGFGAKIKDFLIGRDENGKPTGILTKIGEAITNPMEYQLKKTIWTAGQLSLKHVFGPLSDLGRSIKDRANRHVDEVLTGWKQKAKEGLKTAGGAIVQGLGSATAGLIGLTGKIGVTAKGNAARATMRVVGGAFGGTVSKISNTIAGKNSFHKLKDDELYPLEVGQVYRDPLDKDNPVKELEDGYEDSIHKVRYTKMYPNGVVLLYGNRPNEWQPRTRDYNKWRKEKRDAKLKGKFLNYKEWKKEKWERTKSLREELEKDMAEAEAKEGQEKIVEKIEDQTEIQSEIRDSVQELVDESKGPNCIFVHEQGLRDRFDDLYQFLTGDEYQKRDYELHPNTKDDTEDTQDASVVDNEVESSVQEDAAVSENEAEVKSPQNAMTREPSLLRVMDQGVHDRLDHLIEFLTGSPYQEKQKEPEETEEENIPVVDTGESVIHGEQGTEKIVSAIKESSDKDEDESFANEALASATTLASADQEISNKEAKIHGEIAEEAAKDDSNKYKMSSLLKEMMAQNQKQKQESEKNEEKKSSSFLSGLLGGIGSVLLKNWPILLGGLTFLSDDFRDLLFNKVLPSAADWLLNTAFPAVGSWLTKHLPDIINMGMNVVEDANRAIYDYGNDAEARNDEVTGERAAFRTNETLQEDYEEGILKSSWNDNANLLQAGADVWTTGKISTPLTPVLGAAGNALLNHTPVGRSIMNKYGYSGSPLNANMGPVRTALAGAGGLALDVAVGAALSATTRTTMEAIDRNSHANLGDNYGFGTPGGYKTANPMGTTLVSGGLTTAGRIIVGMAFSSAVKGGLVSAAAATLGFPPAAVVAGIVGATIVIANILAALFAFYRNQKKNTENEDYSVRSNATKMFSVISGDVTYETGSMDNLMYVYNPKDSDRMLGLDAGYFVKDPEVMFGRLLGSVMDQMNVKNEHYLPGCEVLLFDLINNMAVQGVPFAVKVAGNSKEVSMKGKQANGDYSDDSNVTRTGPLGGKYIQVIQKTVEANEDIILEDIQTNISRSNGVMWDYDDLQAAYDIGLKVRDLLKQKGILDSGGSVNTSKFGNTEVTGKSNGSSGWDILINLVKTKDDIQLFWQCISYINSKIKTDSDGHQWVDVWQDKITSCVEIIQSNLGIDTSEIHGTNSHLADADGGSQSSGAPMTSSEAGALRTGSTRENRFTDQDPLKQVPSYYRDAVERQLKYLTATYMYSHPDVLQNWVNKVGLASGIDNDDIRGSISKWYEESESEKRKMILNGMKTAALTFASQYFDIYDLASKYDWENERLLDRLKEYGSGDILGSVSSTGGLIGTTLEEIWNNQDMTENVDPNFMHSILAGSSEHGENGENPLLDSFMTPIEMGVLGEIGNRLSYLGVNQGDYSKDPDPRDPNYNVKRAIADLNPDRPVNLPSGIGGPDDEEESDTSRIATNNKNFGLGGPSPEPEPEPDSVPTTNPEQALYDRLANTNNPFMNAILNGYSDPVTALMNGVDLRQNPLLLDAQETTGMEGDGPDSVISEEGGNPLSKDYKVSSPFGWRNITGTPEGHKGIDLIPQDGSGEAEVGARYNGVVTAVKRDVPDSHRGLNVDYDKAGNYVFYETPDGKVVKNMHLKAGSIPSSIQKGSPISIGDKIGDMGTTGRSSGKHLHYQIETPEGNYVDPEPYISGGSTISSFNNTDTGSGLGSFSSNNSSGSTDSNDGLGVLGQAFNIVKELGMTILSTITGGLLGSTSDNPDASIADGGSTFDYNGITITPDTITNVDDFLKMVENEIGTKESPAGSNKQKYGEWYGMNGSPWCMMFVQWCYNQAGLPIEYRTAKCSSLYEWYAKNRPNQVWAAGQGMPKKGDVVIFKNSGGSISHTGIIYNPKSSTSITTIEGNTSSGNAGSQDNGGIVAKKERSTTSAGMKFAYYIRVIDWEELERAAKAAQEAMSNVGEGAEGMFYYLKSLGYSDEAAAAIVGCWQPESHNVAKKVEADYVDRWFMNGLGKGSKEAAYDAIATDRAGTDIFTQKIIDDLHQQYLDGKLKYDTGGAGYHETGKKDNSHLYPGLGYAQWTGPEAKELVEYAKQKNMKWYDPGLQLSFFDRHLNTSYKALKEKLQKPTTIEQATHDFAYDYENPNMPSSQYVDRIAAAKEIYNKLKGTTPPNMNQDMNQTEVDYATMHDPEQRFGGPDDEGNDMIISDNQNNTIFDERDINKNDGVGGPDDKIIHDSGSPRKEMYGPKVDIPDPTSDQLVGVGGPDDDSTISSANYTKFTNPPRDIQIVKKSTPKEPTAAIGGPGDSTYKYTPPETSGTSDTSTIQVVESSTANQLDPVIQMLSQMLSALESIRNNTGDSTDLLASLNEKDFVDQGVRDSITALGKMKNNRSRSSSNTGASTIMSLVTP